jgi:hypothetical protein
MADLVIQMSLYPGFYVLFGTGADAVCKLADGSRVAGACAESLHGLEEAGSGIKTIRYHLVAGHTSSEIIYLRRSPSGLDATAILVDDPGVSMITGDCRLSRDAGTTARRPACSWHARVVPEGAIRLSAKFPARSLSYLTHAPQLSYEMFT